MRAHLLSVNVGRPQPIERRGRTTFTAIAKSPVAGRVAVRGVNVKGDDQADRVAHGGPDKAVYAYASEDYAWWAQALEFGGAGGPHVRAGGGAPTQILEFMVDDVGPGTERLAALQPGEELWVTGPLGVGFQPPADGRRALLCGGGVGTAPLAILQDELLAAGLSAPALLGFRDRAHAAGAELLANPRVATDDGSVGHHGLVTDLLATELDGDDRATVYACGPPAMLEAVRALCAAREVPAQLALESGMACGFGACFGCVVPLLAGGYARICVEGPVLDARRLAEVPAH
jgi:dihydroorotate dehydrogenase electron transfer subunit